MTTLTDERPALDEQIAHLSAQRYTPVGQAILDSLEQLKFLRGREGGGKGEADRLLIDSRSAFNAIALTSSTEDLVAHDFLDMCTIAQQSRQAIDAYFLAGASPAPQVAETLTEQQRKNIEIAKTWEPAFLIEQLEELQQFIEEHEIGVGYDAVLIAIANTRASMLQPVAESQGADALLADAERHLRALWTGERGSLGLLLERIRAALK